MELENIYHTPLIEHSKLNEKMKRELMEYLSGNRREFSISFDEMKGGTAFQRKVWEECKKIPFGETLTYQELAERIGHPKAYRAVGNALGKNPYPILIPCHRVIGKSTQQGGYAGGIGMKQMLLNFECNKKD